MIESPKDFAARIYGLMAAASGGGAPAASSDASSAAAATVEPEVL